LVDGVGQNGEVDERKWIGFEFEILKHLTVRKAGNWEECVGWFPEPNDIASSAFLPRRPKN